MVGASIGLAVGGLRGGSRLRGGLCRGEGGVLRPQGADRAVDALALVTQAANVAEPLGRVRAGSAGRPVARQYSFHASRACRKWPSSVRPAWTVTYTPFSRAVSASRPMTLTIQGIRISLRCVYSPVFQFSEAAVVSTAS